MHSLWTDADAATCENDLLLLRVYTSRLLGREPSLVLHGGGNTSVKAKVTTLLGDTEEVLYIKGSGWDLATIQAGGFAPVRLDALCRMARLERMTDTEMVNAQRAAMTDPNAPTPSVEAILHAIIPFTFVDHTHADAVVAISNTPNGEARIRELYGEKVLVVPYVMPGFILARQIYEMTQGLDWSRLEGMVLLHHGVFSFGTDARTSYERMINLVNEAETYLLKAPSPVRETGLGDEGSIPERGGGLDIARLRRAAAEAAGVPLIAQVEDNPEVTAFLGMPNLSAVATRGPLTPDHVIRTKPIPLVVGADPVTAVQSYAATYRAYFARHAGQGLTSLDPAPRWVLWPGVGSITLGASARDAAIARDITRHTMRAIQWAEAMGGWTALPERDLFDVEYWELEQAKLKKSGVRLPLQGKVALVTGAASGIGRACVEALNAQGAAVVGLDLNPEVSRFLARQDLVGLVGDVTKRAMVDHAVEETVRRFGGLDILVSNAGIFPPSRTLAEMDAETWDRSLDLNLTSHRHLLQAAIPYLLLGLDPSVVIVASKNVPAPGPGAGAYSVAKAGLTQLARIAALELAKDGIRVNTIHPHAVFDTGAWTPEVLAERARQYGQSIEDYKRGNLLRTEVTSRDVAALVCAMVGPAFARTTGAQVPIDGGNDRVI